MNSLLLDVSSKIDGLVKKTGPFGDEVDSFVAEKKKKWRLKFHLTSWSEL